jgi:hypothetical protein
MQVGEHVVSQTSLYVGLFVIGLPVLWWSSPLGTLFWIVCLSPSMRISECSLTHLP